MTKKLRPTSARILCLVLLSTILANAFLVLPMMVKPAAAQADVLVKVDSSRIIAMNNFSIGFMLDQEWKGYADNSVRRGLARDAGFKLIRVFDWKSTSPHPCTQWNESNRTGTCNWTDIDTLVQRILEIGAQPMFCLGASGSDGPLIPSGMAVNPDTNLPYPESFAAYASDWVRHFKANGLPVRFYEIWNEPWTYFGWEPVAPVKLANYMQLFNAAAASMRGENPNLLISFDFIVRKPVLDYWLANGGADVDYLDFHKYDSWSVGQYTDAELLGRAESQYFGTWPMGYSVDDARRVWLNARGKLLPVVGSEGNLNSAWDGGTDPKIQQLVGAVWTALVLRMGIMNGLSYNIYYSLSSSASWGKKTSTGGAGFGMINADVNKPWYPYYVQYLLGRNLAPGDSLVDSASSIDDVRALAWIHNGMLNVLLICKVDQPRTVYLQGVAGQASLVKIDNAVPWTTPALQSGAVNVGEPLIMNGYTVALLQAPVAQVTPTYTVTVNASTTDGSPLSGIQVTLGSESKMTDSSGKAEFSVSAGTYTLGVQSPVAGGSGIQYILAQWTGGGSQSSTSITVNGPATYGVSYNAQLIVIRRS